MTHRSETVGAALALASKGLSPTQIAVEIGIPRRTVDDWVRGLVPNTHLRAGTSCDVCGGPGHLFDYLPADYVYLLGLYLGDGCIATHRRGVFKLRLSLDARYPGIIVEAERAMSSVLPNKVNRKMYDSYAEVYAYSKSWPCLFPQHGVGKKHERRIQLTGWQQRAAGEFPQLLLRGLIHSDGCRFMNTGRGWIHPRYSFSNLSPDIRAIFCAACDDVGVHWTASGHTIYVSRKADVAVLDGFIGPKA